MTKLDNLKNTKCLANLECRLARVEKQVFSKDVRYTMPRKPTRQATTNTMPSKGREYSNNCDPVEPPIRFYTERVKPLAKLTPNDVPLGLDPEDVATDYLG